MDFNRAELTFSLHQFRLTKRSFFVHSTTRIAPCLCTPEALFGSRIVLIGWSVIVAFPGYSHFVLFCLLFSVVVVVVVVVCCIWHKCLER